MKYKIGFVLNVIAIFFAIIISVIGLVGVIQGLIWVLDKFREQVSNNPWNVALVLIPVVVLASVYSIMTEFRDLKHFLGEDEPL